MQICLGCSVSYDRIARWSKAGIPCCFDTFMNTRSGSPPMSCVKYHQFVTAAIRGPPNALSDLDNEKIRQAMLSMSPKSEKTSAVRRGARLSSSRTLEKGSSLTVELLIDI